MEARLLWTTPQKPPFKAWGHALHSQHVHRTVHETKKCFEKSVRQQCFTQVSEQRLLVLYSLYVWSAIQTIEHILSIHLKVFLNTEEKNL